MEHRKPTAISRKLDPAKQAAFIRSYEALLNQLPADEAVMFADAVHPTHAMRAVGCWAPKDIPVAITQSSGRERLNIHGGIDLETGNTRMLRRAGGECCEHHPAANGDRGDVSWKAADPCISGQRPVWCSSGWRGRNAGSGCTSSRHTAHTSGPDRMTLGFDAQAITHNKCHETFKDFSDAILTFLRRRSTPGTGTATAMRSPTTSASFRQRIFGFSRERSKY